MRPSLHRPPSRLLAVCALAALTSLRAAAAEPEAPAAPQQPEPASLFAEVAAEAGLDFVHWNGRTGDFYFPEMTGAGAALFDADGDGDLEVYLVQGAPLPGTPLEPFAGREPPRDRLFRNDTAAGAGGSRTLRFTDVTDASGLRALGYGMGAATGDVDGDGRVDLYVLNFGANQLWRNVSEPGPDGGIRFTDITASSGTGDPAWSTGASFFDADGDGDLDLYVVNYVDFRLDNNVTCYATSSRRDYCGPSAYPATADTFYLNRGLDAGGTVRFEAVTRQTLFDYRAGKGLGVIAADFDGDGKVDLFVANDGEPNQLWRNESEKGGAPAFRDDALLAGVAVNRAGQPEASMGVAAADFDDDGDRDLFVTHLDGETNTLYVNAGGGLFDDRTAEHGLAAPSLPFTGFGTGWLDADGDGRLDLLAVNGAVRVQEARARAGDSYPLDQSDLLLLARPGSSGGTSFENATARAGATFATAAVSRGAAFGDLDDDGDTDVVVLDNHGPARLLRNDGPGAGAWLGLRLALPGARDRDAIGARAALTLGDGRTLHRWVATDGSYASASDPRLLFRLGPGAEPKALRVIWADGEVERFALPPLGAYATLRRGSGKPER